MRDKLIHILTTTAGRLIFSLASGCAYFMFLYPVMVRLSRGSAYLACSFSPAIIFGAALLIIKLMKQAEENENPKGIVRLFIIHSILFVIGSVSIVTAIL